MYIWQCDTEFIGYTTRNLQQRIAERKYSAGKHLKDEHQAKIISSTLISTPQSWESVGGSRHLNSTLNRTPCKSICLNHHLFHSAINFERYVFTRFFFIILHETIWHWNIYTFCFFITHLTIMSWRCRSVVCS